MSALACLGKGGNERIERDATPIEARRLPSDTTEAYCRQLVSEGRVKKPSGGYLWVQRWRDNHFLDCEAMAYAAAYMLGVHRIADSAQRRRQGPRPRPQEVPVAKPATSVAAMARLNR